ncbi:MAG: alpha-L-rhamnosidase N-terminal domain-containing protein [Ginsengibacter sp.]
MKMIPFFPALLFFSAVTFSQVTIKNLRCENLNNPIGIDVRQPRLRWQLFSDTRNTLQTAYEISVSESKNLSNDMVWSSRKVTTDQSVFVPYSGDTLQSAKKYYWKVRVWDNTERASAWSKPSFWQMGLLTTSDWKAKWIEAATPADSINAPALLFRKQFNTQKKIKDASVNVTAHGMYEAMINGNRMGDAYLTPGWTSYNKRLQYRTYDVTSLLKPGENAIGVTVGSGWYRTPLAWGNNKNLYGNKIALLFQLVINYTDGSSDLIISDASWKSSDGPVRTSEFYAGETYDANFEKGNWANAGYDDKNWATQLVINAAKVLGQFDDVATYTTLLQKIKDAFLNEYVTPNGRLISGTQTAYVLALNFDMLPDQLRAHAADRLVENIKDYNNHLTTGFLGTPYLCHVLTRFGYDSMAYKLLLQQTYPSWLYPVKMGATTIWERWDGEKPDSTFQNPEMNSFNHYAYGAIGDWMYRIITGLDTYEEGAGYKQIRIKPHPGGNLTYTNAGYETLYGKVASNWKKENGHLIMDVEIPANTTAKIYIPSANTETIMESGRNLSTVNWLKIIGKEENYFLVEAGSGIYHFTD